MKLTKSLIAASIVTVMSAAQAAPQPPTSAPLKPSLSKAHHSANNSAKNSAEAHFHDHREHGIEKEASNNRAPTAQSPLSSSLSNLKNAAVPNLLAKNNTSSVLAGCDLNALTTSNTNTLINEIKTQGTNCINELFSADAATQQSVYTSSKMVAVADHVRGLSTSYAGGGDVDIQAMFLFLRAGYYVEFYNSNVSFSASVKPAVKNAIDAFVNNSHFYDDNDEHGKTLSEVMITMDSSEQQDVYLYVAKEWLSRWNQSYAGKWNMRSAVNGVFTLIYRGPVEQQLRCRCCDRHHVSDSPTRLCPKQLDGCQ